MRQYPGVSATQMPERHVRKAMRDIDSFLRDAGKALADALALLGAQAATPPVAASFITANAEASLSGERKLVVTSPLAGSDGGANGNYTLSLNVGALGAIPAITWGTAFAGGAAGTFIRTDATLRFPTALQNDTN